jgi:hypothetical protein
MTSDVTPSPWPWPDDLDAVVAAPGLHVFPGGGGGGQ